MRLVLLNQFFRDETLAGAPDEIHFGVKTGSRRRSAIPMESFCSRTLPGKLDMSKYQERVGDVGVFERGVAEDIAREKLEAFVAASVRISEDDVQQEYKRKNTNFDLTYVVVSADKLAEKIQPTDDELKAYYDKHKTDYNILVPQKKIKYRCLLIRISQARNCKYPTKNLQDEYDGLKPEFKQAGVKVQQIVLKVARPDLDATVKAKADESGG